MTPRRSPRDERGAVTVIVAALLPVMLLASAVALDGLALSAGEREHQRAADAAALTAAAAIPLVSLDALPLGGGAWAPGATAADRACAVAGTMLDQSAATSAYRQGASGCAVTFEPDDPALLTAVSGAVAPILANASVLAQLGASTTQLAAGLVPAVAAPRARVVTGSAVQPPLAALSRTALTSPDVAGEAVARRRIKNAVLLPVLDLQGACPSANLLTGLLTWLTGSLQDLLASADTIGELADGLADCRADANPALDQSAAALFPRLEAAGARLDQLGLPGSALTSALVRDLRDVADPSGAAAPTQRDILEAAAQDDEHVLVVLAGVSGATQIPVLDVFPVLAADLMARDLSQLHMADLFSLATDTALARGIFRATLVR